MSLVSLSLSWHDSNGHHHCSILLKDISMALVHLSLSLPEIAEWLNSLSKTPMALVLTVQHFLLPLDLQKDLNFFQFPKLSKHKEQNENSNS